MEQKRVVVLYGGQSTEHEISRRSAKFVIQNADRSKYEIIPVGIDKTGKVVSPELGEPIKVPN